MVKYLIQLMFCILVTAVLTIPSLAQVNDAALMQARPAKLLSAYGLFENGSAQTPAAGVVAFGIKVPLFTDYAHKYRFVYMPANTAATFDPHEVFKFPVGTVLVKTFAYPADFRKPNENVRLIETRLILHQKNGWNAWAYVWNEEQTDAVLKVAGKTIPVTWIDEAGEAHNTDYVVPNKNQCKGCHIYNGIFSPIGPKARNLNYDFPSGGAHKNQLQQWVDANMLKRLPPLSDIESVASVQDEGATLEARARAYLDINCAHCHRLEGPASTSGLFFTFAETNNTTLGFMKRPVAAGRGSGNLLYDIVPGDADASILVHRIKSLDPGIMMPELGRTMVHEEGLALLKNWINQLK